MEVSDDIRASDGPTISARGPERALTWSATLGRIAAGLGIAVVTGTAALLLLLLGVTELSGCFFACPNDPNPLGGVALLAGAVASGAAAVTALAWGLAGQRWRLTQIYLVTTAVLGAYVAVNLMAGG